VCARACVRVRREIEHARLVSRHLRRWISEINVSGPRHFTLFPFLTCTCRVFFLIRKRRTLWESHWTHSRTVTLFFLPLTNDNRCPPGWHIHGHIHYSQIVFIVYQFLGTSENGGVLKWSIRCDELVHARMKLFYDALILDALKTAHKINKVRLYI